MEPLHSSNGRAQSVERGAFHLARRLWTDADSEKGFDAQEKYSVEQVGWLSPYCRAIGRNAEPAAKFGGSVGPHLLGYRGPEGKAFGGLPQVGTAEECGYGARLPAVVGGGLGKERRGDGQINHLRRQQGAKVFVQAVGSELGVVIVLGEDV
ncbi:hypothetical protein JHN53_10610 [Streptomyces sp. MBT58]|uniref:hypothetical protein n=1 Tax=Streptomyces sp. MBT58 TaxID=1488389 RepID=UPI001911BA8D|nr:hypothetical protein [Streptomyces sp. MBT58]MBK5992090.1 hypothetical protein [Streptomyces sp. MBT58]